MTWGDIFSPRFNDPAELTAFYHSVATFGLKFQLGDSLYDLAAPQREVQGQDWVVSCKYIYTVYIYISIIYIIYTYGPVSVGPPRDGDGPFVYMDIYKVIQVCVYPYVYIRFTYIHILGMYIRMQYVYVQIYAVCL